jgi:hypothetical protein
MQKAELVQDTLFRPFGSSPLALALNESSDAKPASCVADGIKGLLLVAVFAATTGAFVESPTATKATSATAELTKRFLIFTSGPPPHIAATACFPSVALDNDTTRRC